MGRVGYGSRFFDPNLIGSGSDRVKNNNMTRPNPTRPDPLTPLQCRTISLSKMDICVDIWIRAANESSSSESGLVQTRLMKNQVKSSRARETLQAKKSSSSSARYYSS
jgi:hypothetical protein